MNNKVQIRLQLRTLSDRQICSLYAKASKFDLYKINFL